MSTLNIEAHNLSDEFKSEILADYGVTVVDESNAPWVVGFSGDKDKLIQMVQDNWGSDVYSSVDLEDMISN